MDTKVAAANSLYIIFFGQFFSLIAALATGTVPPFCPMALALMVIGGIFGGMTGRVLNKRMSSRHAAAHNLYRNSGILPVNLSTFFFGPQIATPKYCRVLSGTWPIFSTNSS